MVVPLEERFWAKVNKTEGCWEWNASLNTGGYGQISVDGGPRPAHRVSWELHNGEIPEGLCVLHRCDNRLCVRPDHLFLGTRKDNSIDMHGKGRWRHVPAGKGLRRKRSPRVSYGPAATSPTERFWPKVDTQNGDVELCWPFMGYRDHNGYGLFFLGDNGRKGRKHYAHRVAYALHYGEFDARLVVMHTCDNPPCCNPAHLRLGTRADNNRDRSSKGRGRENRQWGEANTNSKLTENDVEEILRLSRLRVTQMEIAYRFGIKQPQVSRIVRGHSWRHLDQ